MNRRTKNITMIAVAVLLAVSSVFTVSYAGKNAATPPSPPNQQTQASRDSQQGSPKNNDSNSFNFFLSNTYSKFHYKHLLYK